MIRIFRAFLWMRLRVFVNSFERTGARDTLARFSIAAEKIGPILVLALLIPSATMLFVLGLAAGFGVATDAWAPLMGAIRGILFVVVAITCISPIVIPMRDSSSIVRLLLLPIPRQLLYVAQMAGALGDPWILLTIPLFLGVSIGLAIGLHFAAAAFALAAAAAFVVLLLGIASFASSIIHLLLRDRRRGDIVMLVIVILLSSSAMLPSVLRAGDLGRHLTRAERQALPPSRIEVAARKAFPYVPSELYRSTTLDARARAGAAALPLLGLTVFALVFQTAGFAAFRRVLDMPVSMGARRAGSFGGVWERAIPGLSRGASAVAFTQLRLAVRSPRGRQIMLVPLLIFTMFAIILSKRGGMPFPGLTHAGGLGLAIFGCVICLFAHVPFAFNQFAIDRAGFTRQMLAPLSVDELLVGKAVGNALIIAGPVLLCWAAAAALFPGASPALWISIPLAFVSAYFVFAPIAAALSAAFPRTVDLGSIGNRSNPHQAAQLLGLVSIAASAAPPILLSALALVLLNRTVLVPLFVGAWCLTAYGIFRLLLLPVRRFVTSRRENLGLSG